MDRWAVAAGIITFCLVFLLVVLVEGVVLSTPLRITIPVASIVAVGAGLLAVFQTRHSA